MLQSDTGQLTFFSLSNILTYINAFLLGYQVSNILYGLLINVIIWWACVESYLLILFAYITKLIFML